MIVSKPVLCLDIAGTTHAHYQCSAWILWRYLLSVMHE